MPSNSSTDYTKCKPLEEKISMYKVYNLFLISKFVNTFLSMDVTHNNLTLEQMSLIFKQR